MDDQTIWQKLLHEMQQFVFGLSALLNSHPLISNANSSDLVLVPRTECLYWSTYQVRVAPLFTNYLTSVLVVSRSTCLGAARLPARRTSYHPYWLHCTCNSNKNQTANIVSWYKFNPHGHPTMCATKYPPRIIIFRAGHLGCKAAKTAYFEAHQGYHARAPTPKQRIWSTGT
jgi:hypothetical protein